MREIKKRTEFWYGYRFEVNQFEDRKGEGELILRRTIYYRRTTGWTAEVHCRQSAASKQFIGLTQPPIKWLSLALSPGVKRPVPRAEVKNSVELYLHSLIHLHGVVLN
jgi:hypothetical protein